jgi:hypothetical protein
MYSLTQEMSPNYNVHKPVSSSILCVLGCQERFFRKLIYMYAIFQKFVMSAIVITCLSVVGAILVD